MYAECRSEKYCIVSVIIGMIIAFVGIILLIQDSGEKFPEFFSGGISLMILGDAITLSRWRRRSFREILKVDLWSIVIIQMLIIMSLPFIVDPNKMGDQPYLEELRLWVFTLPWIIYFGHKTLAWISSLLGDEIERRYTQKNNEHA